MSYQEMFLCILTNSSPTLSKNASAGGERRLWNQEHCRGQSKTRVNVEEEDRTRLQERATIPVGVCQTMCPAWELQKRESQNCLHRFEMLAGTERDRRPRGDPMRAVKEYSRPAAGKDSTKSTDLRPPAVLLKTVCYLIDEIAASPRLHPWTEVLLLIFYRNTWTVDQSSLHRNSMNCSNSHWNTQPNLVCSVSDH